MPASLQIDDAVFNKYYISQARGTLESAVTKLSRTEEYIFDSGVDKIYISKIVKLITTINKIHKELGELYASDNIRE